MAEPVKDVVERCEDLIEIVADCLAQRMRKGAIKRTIREAMGEGVKGLDGKDLVNKDVLDKIVCTETIEKLITLARRQMIARVRVSRGIYKTDIVEFLGKVLSDPRASYRDKLEANRQLIEIAGVTANDSRADRKLKHEIGKTEPNSPTGMSAETAEKLRSSLEQMEGEVT